MRFFYCIVFFIITVYSCSSSKGIPYYGDCNKYVNDYAEVIEDEFIIIKENDSLSYTEIRFQCTNSSMYNLRTMYGSFGRWHRTIQQKKFPKLLLVWENIELLSDGQRYNIIIFGSEKKRSDISSSVLIVDSQGIDMLDNNEELKTSVINFFSDNIRNNTNISDEFYFEYMKVLRKIY